jgi:hypothetical protein
MANLSTAIAVYRDNLAAMTNTIAALSEKLFTRDTCVKANDDEIECLTQGCAPAKVQAPVGPAITYVRMLYKTNNYN